MALVHVEHLGRGQALDVGERPDRPHPADTGEDLLLDPVLLVAAVEPVGDTAQVVLVLRDVGIQQQQRDSADLGDPHPRPQLAGIGHGELDQHRVAVAVGEQPQRQALRVQRRIVLVLPTVGGQRLPEVARAVVQARPRSAAAPDPTPTSGGRRPGCPGHRSSSAAPRRRRTPSRSTRCRSAAPRRQRPAAGTTAGGPGSCPVRRRARRAARGTTRRRRVRRAVSG